MLKQKTWLFFAMILATVFFFAGRCVQADTSTPNGCTATPGNNWCSPGYCAIQAACPADGNNGNCSPLPSLGCSFGTQMMNGCSVCVLDANGNYNVNQSAGATPPNNSCSPVSNCAYGTQIVNGCPTCNPAPTNQPINPTNNPTPPAGVIIFPTDQTACLHYKGTWCANATVPGSNISGTCLMANMTCQATPPNTFACWNGATLPVSASASCPMMPTNSAACTAGNGQWCAANNNQPTGFCMSRYLTCPNNLTPPAGLGTCPDGTSFATSLSGCPTASQTIQPVIQPQPTPATTTMPTTPTVKQCPDGSIAPINAACLNQLTYVACPDGHFVTGGQACASTSSPITACTNAGGVWCPGSQTPGQNLKNGFCNFTGVACTSVTLNLNPAPTTVAAPLSAGEQSKGRNNLTAAQNLLNNLKATFTANNDPANLAKTVVLQTQLSAITLPLDSTSNAKLNLIYSELSVLQTVAHNPKASAASLDGKVQTLAIADLKTLAVQFNDQLIKAQKQAARLVGQGFVLPAGLRAELASAQTLAASLKTATAYAAAKILVGQLQTMKANLDDDIISLNQLTQAAGFYAKLGNAIAKTKTALTNVAAAAKKIKLGTAGEKQNLQTVQTAYQNLKTNLADAADPLGDLQATVIDPLNKLNYQIAGLAAITHLASSYQAYNRLEQTYLTLNNKNPEATVTTLLSQAADDLAQVKLYLQDSTSAGMAEILTALTEINSLFSQVDLALPGHAPASVPPQLQLPTPTAADQLPALSDPTSAGDKADQIMIFFHSAKPSAVLGIKLYQAR